VAARAGADQLLDLARSRLAADRERLLAGLIDLCEASPEAARQPSVRGLLDDVFITLATEAEREIRRLLSEKLARADWAPKPLIETLALDEIDIARPVIAGSPLLEDDDLIRLLVEATVEHQIEVARRPHLPETVVDAVIDLGEPAVMTALAGNRTAAVDDLRLERLIDASREIASLRAPLARHPGLSRRLAEQLYVWVGQALRTAIADRFEVDEAELARAIDEAARDAFFRGERSSPRAAPDAQTAREAMERRLVEKLHAAGQLRPGYLVKALRDGKATLFEAALAVLGGFEPAAVRRAARERADLLALACMAVGLDRLVFPDVMARARKLNGASPRPSPEESARIAQAFLLRPQQAGDAFRAANAG
jgi:uncharacterized protein (DUF2336 family)